VRLPQGRPAWPLGHDRASYTEVVRGAILGAAERARLASLSTGMASEDTPHLKEWAIRLATVADLWLEEGGANASSALKMIEHALDATIVADASAPAGMHARVEGGLVAQWVHLLDALDPKWSSRKPKTAEELARRICVEWTATDNPDRRDPATGTALDTAAAQLLFATLDGPGIDDMPEILTIAREETDALEVPAPYSRRRLDRWEAFVRRRRSAGGSTGAETRAGSPTTTAGVTVGVAAGVAGMTAAAAAAETAETIASVSRTIVETNSTLDKALIAVVSSLDAAFDSANKLVKRVVEAVSEDHRQRTRGSR